MTDEDFRKICNTYGFAPSRALRELIDCVRMQEIEACAKVCEETTAAWTQHLYNSGCMDCAAAIRARKEKQ